MAGRISRFLDQRRQAREMARWSEAADRVEELRPAALRRMEEEARQLHPALDRIHREAERRRIARAPAPPPPPGADWLWRAAPWSSLLPVPAIVGLPTGTEICPGLRAFHDSRLNETTLRQIRANGGEDRPPLALSLDTLGFDGTFLSLVFDLPETALRGLGRRHLIRLDTVIEAEEPPEIYARLNIQSGPNTEQLIRELPQGDGRTMVEFDLAYTQMNEKRVQRLWLDLIFGKVAMNRIVIGDMLLGRRPRADL